jgi:hypothetical protein
MMKAMEQDPVERLAWRRARMASGLAFGFLAIQATEVSRGATNERFDLAFALWSAILVVILLFGGGWLSGARIRGALNDETTIAHRREALACGFLITLASAFVIYGLSFFKEVTAAEALRLLITFAVSGSLLRFAGLERRALRQ